MILFIFITAMLVSIDSFICGFSLSLLKIKRSYIVFGITLTVLVMCLITNYLALLLSNILTEQVASYSGLILVAMGIFNLLKKEKQNIPIHQGIKQIFLTGVVVGFDGAIANLSLSLMGLNLIYVPLIIAVMHGIMIYLGVLLPSAPIINGLKKYSFIAPIILILMGIYKFLGVFI